MDSGDCNVPEIMTRRLLLRPFDLSDSKDVRRLAGNISIAATTLNVPHPYEDGMAEEWIGTHKPGFQEGKLANFAVTLQGTGELVGTVGLTIESGFNRAEMGYWIGRPYWNRGYCTESAEAVLKYAFDVLSLNRVYASYFSGNTASGRVMEKLGMKMEGLLRGHVLKDGTYRDLIFYGILRCDHESASE